MAETILDVACLAYSGGHDHNLVAIIPRNKHYNISFGFNHLSAKLGPETRSNGSGSKNGTDCTKINPGDHL